MPVRVALAGDTMLGRGVAERLAEIGVTCVTLANDHVLDFGPEALRDTLTHLRAAGVTAVGAGPDDAAAAAPSCCWAATCASGSSPSPTIRARTPQHPTGPGLRSPTSTTASPRGCASAPRPGPTPTW